MFADRAEAAGRLVPNLKVYRGSGAVVLALPRGGVVLGRIVADQLRLPLDIVVTRKIGHPDDPECAVCAIDAMGHLVCDEAARSRLDPAWITLAAKRAQAEAVRRERVYRRDRPVQSFQGRTVIIVDDGIATGLTMRAAIALIQTERPRRIIVAVPVAPVDVIRMLRQMVDKVIVLVPPEQFAGSVGAHYHAFPPVTDDVVIDLLR